MNSLAVLISDIHYSTSTLTVADSCLRKAINSAKFYKIPVIICGDLLNDKAIIHGRVANTIIETLKYANSLEVKVYILVGNHDLLNEKGKEHSLHFLRPYAEVIDEPKTLDGFNFIPYQTNPQDFYDALNKFPKGSLVIGHQGVIGGDMGDYIVDHSALDLKYLNEYKIFLGHYHMRQRYNDHVVSVGNPYTLSFGEANHPTKGYLLLSSDFTYLAYATDMRVHTVYNSNNVSPFWMVDVHKHLGDPLWIKIRASSAELRSFDRLLWDETLGRKNYKIDLIPNDSPYIEIATAEQSDREILYNIIDNLKDSDEYKNFLRNLCDETIKLNS